MVFIDQHLVVVLSGSRVASGLDMPISRGEYVVMFKFAAGLLGDPDTPPSVILLISCAASGGSGLQRW